MTIASKVARPFLLVLVGMFVSSLEARRQVDERYYQDMKWRRIYLVVAIFLTGLAAFAIAAYQDNAGSEARLTGVITFLYYEDFERASRFYGEALGLPKTYDRDDVEVFSVTASASVGIIDIRRRGPDARVAPGDKSAGISFIVDELDHVDQWYERLKRAGVDAEPPSDGTETPVRSVQFHDPEGYPMEVFAWLPER